MTTSEQIYQIATRLASGITAASDVGALFQAAINVSKMERRLDGVAQDANGLHHSIEDSIDGQIMRFQRRMLG